MLCTLFIGSSWKKDDFRTAKAWGLYFKIWVPIGRKCFPGLCFEKIEMKGPIWRLSRANRNRIRMELLFFEFADFAQDIIFLRG